MQIPNVFSKFESVRRHERDPRPADDQKKGSVALMSSDVSTLDAWAGSNERATTDAHDESERARRDRGFRLLSYSLIGAALLFYVGISYVMGWGSFR